MVPDPNEVALRDARRLAVVLSELGHDVAPIGSGWMASDLPGSWADHASGLGVDGPVDEETIDRLVAFYRERGRVPRIRVTPYQHRSLFERLGARGFSVHELDSILLHDLERLPDPVVVPGLTFRSIDPGNEEDVARFRESQVAGFFDAEPVPAGYLPITERVGRSTRCRLWLLELDGAVVGSGGLEPFEGSAVLICGCVHPEARRRGIQSAFIRYRIEQARAAGLDYAIIGSEPGAGSERNALRAGFVPMYTQFSLQLQEPREASSSEPDSRKGDTP